jgi:transcriptional regulator with XRE-family HTH domain
MTIEEFGAAAELSMNTLSRFEREISMPHERTLRVIIGVLWVFGIEVFGTAVTNRGIRDTWTEKKRREWEAS